MGERSVVAHYGEARIVRLCFKNLRVVSSNELLMRKQIVGGSEEICEEALIVISRNDIMNNVHLGIRRQHLLKRSVCLVSPAFVRMAVSTELGCLRCARSAFLCRDPRRSTSK